MMDGPFSAPSSPPTPHADEVEVLLLEGCLAAAGVPLEVGVPAVDRVARLEQRGELRRSPRRWRRRHDHDEQAPGAFEGGYELFGGSVAMKVPSWPNCSMVSVTRTVL